MLYTRQLSSPYAYDARGDRMDTRGGQASATRGAAVGRPGWRHGHERKGGCPGEGEGGRNVVYVYLFVVRRAFPIKLRYYARGRAQHTPRKTNLCSLQKYSRDPLWP